ncbi:hypothetical protein HID58_093148 [Brassica napus]|uniref:Uncharacterized protein n=1 Tax=Brassica napus TaxID=3708 RepID=A0ABQ7XC09_BRANA|nr:hypothetical protein HID58_093916 [Brassica napus]KAH0853490.1 hypothetical protein HID58_093148 [Brassica napus]
MLKLGFRLKLGFISYPNQSRLRLEEEVSTTAVKEELSTAVVTEELSTAAVAEVLTTMAVTENSDDGEVDVVVRGRKKS